MKIKNIYIYLQLTIDFYVIALRFSFNLFYSTSLLSIQRSVLLYFYRKCIAVYCNLRMQQCNKIGKKKRKYIKKSALPLRRNYLMFNKGNFRFFMRTKNLLKKYVTFEIYELFGLCDTTSADFSKCVWHLCSTNENKYRKCLMF